MPRLIFLLIPLFFISCQEKANEEQIKKTLIRSLEQSFDETFWLEDNLEIERRNLFLMKTTPHTKRRAVEFEPKFMLTQTICKEIDDFLINHMNHLLYLNNDEKIYVEKNHNFILKRDYSISEINSLLSSKTSNKFFFSELNNKESNTNAELIRRELNKFRKKLLSALFKYSKEQINYSSLPFENIDSVRKILNSKWYPYTENVISIYKRLTKPELVAYKGEAISWEESKFKDVPLVSCIEEINNLRKDILVSQKEVYRIYFEEMHKSAINVNKVSTIIIADKKNIKKGDYVTLNVYPYIHDSTAIYPVRHKYDHQPEYNSSFENKFRLETNEYGVKKLEGQIEVEVDNILRAFPWEYQYEVK